MKEKSVKRIIFIAIFAALSSVLYTFPKISLPIFPSFLEINFSMLPIFICCFLLGPIDGIICVIIRCLLKCYIGTNTNYIGEIADLTLGTTTIVAAGFSYKYLKNKRKDSIALGIGIIAWIVTALLSNWLFILPAYIELFFKGEIAPILKACSMIPGINESNYMSKYLLYAVLPFNLLISMVVVTITYIVNKRLKVLYDSLKF